ncbi:MAG TPA: hypothetical protein VFD58_17845 [Blastocatellia bacterium]|nr:hypothetical protein [Blastocatellia bacterium]
MHLEARLRASRQEVESLSQQLQLADERARFAESKAEDFFQRLARERRRATDLSRQLAEAGENIARLNGLIEGRDASVTQLKQAGFERVRDVLIGERDRALKERDDARIQISRLDASLKAVKRDFLSSRTRLRQQLRELEELRDDLIRERDCAVSERDAVLIRVAELETPAPQPGEIDAASEPERDSLLAEIEQERGLSGDLKKENHALSAENHHLLHDLQSATARLMELEVSLSAAAKAAELTKAQLKSDSSQTLSPADQALPEITAEDEIPDPGTMAQTDLLLIRRVDSVVSRLLSTQANE